MLTQDSGVIIWSSADGWFNLQFGNDVGFKISLPKEDVAEIARWVRSEKTKENAEFAHNPDMVFTYVKSRKGKDMYMLMLRPSNCRVWAHLSIDLMESIFLLEAE